MYKRQVLLQLRPLVQDLLGRAGVVVIVLRLVRQPEAAALADLLELRSVGKGVVDLVDRVAGHAEDLPVLHVDIDAAAEQTQVCRDLERLVSGELARPGGQGRGAGQIGALIAGQRRGIAGQAKACLLYTSVTQTFTMEIDGAQTQLRFPLVPGAKKASVAGYDAQKQTDGDLSLIHI